MNKEHVTKGPATVKPFLTPREDDDPMMVYKVEAGDLQSRFDNLPMDEDGNYDQDQVDAIHRENEANAELIAEAFNVLHETGYTPAELVKILKDAHEAMGKVAAMCQVHNPHTGFLNDVNPYDAYRILLPSMVKAGEVFAKYQPVTPA